MSATTPTYEPSAFVIGETLQWTKTLADYLANEGWTLTYYFRPQLTGVGFDIAADADGSSYSVDFETSSVVGLLPGTFTWQSYVGNGSESHFIARGTTIVKKGFLGTAANTAVDDRSTNEVALENIRALLAGKASADQKEYTIANRQLKRYDMDELLALEKRFTQLVNAEHRAEAARQGMPVLQNVYTRFTKPR